MDRLLCNQINLPVLHVPLQNCLAKFHSQLCNTQTLDPFYTKVVIQMFHSIFSYVMWNDIYSINNYVPYKYYYNHIQICVIKTNLLFT